VLQTALDGLFAAQASWRTVAVLLARLPDDEARQGADAVLRSIPQELHGVPADAARVCQSCETAVRTLATLAASTPSLRLLADSPVRPLAPHRGFRLRVADWLPSLVNAGRAFVAIGIVELFWIVTEWPNGAFAITFAAIGILLFSPRADQAYAAAKSFMVGIALDTVLTAIIAFAVLPGLETFEAFSLAIGLYLVPLVL
jgi:uncharacterized membrane protein YccC